MSTPARKAQLINELREQRDALSRALERLSANDATQPIFRREREQASVCDELVRLGEAEVTYRGWIQRARGARAVDLRAEPPLAVALDLGVPPAHALSDIMDVLTSERRASLALIRDLEPADFLRTVRIAGATLSVDDLVGSLVRHDRELTNAIVRGDSSLLPRFHARARASGLERA